MPHLAITQSADGATAAQADGEAPQSLMHQLPPRPPSPYKAMQHGLRSTTVERTSVTSAFLKGRRSHLRGVLPLSAVSAAPLESHSPSPSKSDHRPLDGEDPSSAPSFAPDRGADRALVLYNSPHTGEQDDTPDEHAVAGWQQRVFATAEEHERNALLANEEVAFTNVLLDELHARAELLAGDEAAELVVAAAVERAEARREMLKLIEVEVTGRLREQRMRELLSTQFEALMPAHAAGYRRIEEEEWEDLKQCFQWHKDHRPLGAGCFIKGPEEDYRLRYASANSRSTTSRANSPGSRRWVVVAGSRSQLSSAIVDSRAYAQQLRQSSAPPTGREAALGALAILSAYSDDTTDAGGEGTGAVSTLDGTLGPGDEAVFIEEGKLRLHAQKTRRTEELRKQRRLTDLLEAQDDARQYVLAEEALLWMHITRLAVDGLYAAKEATRQRLLRQEADDAARAEREAQRQALKEQLMKARGISVTADGSARGGGGPGGAHPSSLQPSAARKNSDSTVADCLSPTAGEAELLAAQTVAATPEKSVAAKRDEEDRSLAHLRLIAEEAGESGLGTQLSTLTRDHGGEAAEASDDAEDFLDEL